MHILLWWLHLNLDFHKCVYAGRGIMISQKYWFSLQRSTIIDLSYICGQQWTALKNMIIYHVVINIAGSWQNLTGLSWYRHCWFICSDIATCFCYWNDAIAICPRQEKTYIKYITWITSSYVTQCSINPHLLSNFSIYISIPFKLSWPLIYIFQVCRFQTLWLFN